ncbi:hypothetical protein BQ9231_00572 [Cedratvirus lausannensis]|uniref:Uncharacterized protein n=1 Tax=Cedratvirus lausannensis TaxID=2023205 RepID=A0A285Q2K3_9VIRU|nr:hypothetical protein BQ9231_00572 [Cedratvirus lausannensis]
MEGNKKDSLPTYKKVEIIGSPITPAMLQYFHEAYKIDTPEGEVVGLVKYRAENVNTFTEEPVEM